MLSGDLAARGGPNHIVRGGLVKNTRLEILLRGQSLCSDSPCDFVSGSDTISRRFADY
jgi:hypothetical protein